MTALHSMRQRITLTACLGVLALHAALAGVAAGSAGDDPAIRAELLAQLQNITSYSAGFSQRVTDADGRLVEEGAGTFWLARPDRFRWEYAEPFPRLILADGDRIWLFDEELEQVTVRDMAGLLEQTPAALLAGDTGQLDNYDVRGERDGEILVVQLTPRASRGDFRQIDMAFVSGSLWRLELFDQFGQVTRIDFSNGLVNPEIAADKFTFVVPEGADLIDESS